jgi:serpin B
MTYAGARNNTAKEMAKTLHFTLGNERLHPAFGESLRSIQRKDKKRNDELAVANALFCDVSLAVDPRFQRITQTDYEAGFQLVDFVRGSVRARNSINAWVAANTKNKILDLISPGGIPQSPGVVLVSAIYFKGNWPVAFPKAGIKIEDFTMPGKPALKVWMMNRDLFGGFMENATFQVAQFMYKDNDVSLLVILPKKKDGLAEVEKKLTAKGLSEALAEIRQGVFEVAIPRFKMTNQFSLGVDLATLGMKDAFLPAVADFTGMEKADRRTGDPFYISMVVHQAFVELNEEGTEAAAATGGLVPQFNRQGPQPKPPPPFRADHPFLFLIRHNSSGAILFMGRISEPR